MFAHLQKTMKLILPHSRKRWCCIFGYFFISIEKNICIPEFFTCLNFRDFHPWQQNTLLKDFWLLNIDTLCFYVKKISNGTPMIHSYITTTLGWSLKSHL